MRLAQLAHTRRRTLISATDWGPDPALSNRRKIKFHAILTSGVAFSRGHPASAASWVSGLWANSGPESPGGPGTTSRAAPATSHHSRAAGACAANPEEPPPPPGPRSRHLLLWHLGPPPRDLVAPPAPGVPPRGVLTTSPRRLQSTLQAGPQKACHPANPRPGARPESQHLPILPAPSMCCCTHVWGRPVSSQQTRGLSRAGGDSHSPGGQQPEVKGPSRGSSGEPTGPALSWHLVSPVIPGSQPPLITGPPHPTHVLSELPCSFENTCTGTAGQSCPSDLTLT